ncbi:MAG: hypothetical protein JWO67_6231, partial [Streptosporangiaceae bacterium]|nr:hypothetical protein [Streptosporangiaceae bacterium]
MSYQSRAYDNDHGDPVVVLVATGTHDVSRLVQLLNRGNSEQFGLGGTVVRQVRRHNAGRAALRLLRDHGGPDFTEETEWPPDTISGAAAQSLPIGSVVAWTGGAAGGYRPDHDRTRQSDGKWLPRLSHTARYRVL